ncbi:ATP-dependent protease La domain-containing family protein [Salix suchowensis]|nr:ATP-dependent protease La domain-containing family protein [Salix suchowensis]
MDDVIILEAERHRIQELEFEELHIEEEVGGRDATGAGSSDDFTFNPFLASLHTYLGEVEDTHHRLAFLDGGAVLNLPLFFLEGVVLFPEATLPLRVVQPNFISAVERALVQVESPYIVGVVRADRDSDSDNRQLRFATVGTTAEIRQYRRLEDGSLNVVTRGQQRFHLKRHHWIDVEGMPFGEVQIIHEDIPLRTPKDAFGKLPPLSNLCSHRLSCVPPSNSSSLGYGHNDSDSDTNLEESFDSALSSAGMRIHQSALNSCYYGYNAMDESTSSDDDMLMSQTEMRSTRSHLSESKGPLYLDTGKISDLAKKRVGSKSFWKNTDLNQFHKAPRAFWPHWVYRMYDSYCLAERAADMWKQVVGAPSMDCLVRKPDLLSFYIASKIPVSEETRQELLEIDGISYRFRREIGLLESFDVVQCKTCKTVIAQRSDMVVMSAEGPLGAYVNSHGYVHEIMTLQKANGLALIGRAIVEYTSCETQMGWLFTATKKKLKPQSFWGIRSSQVGDDTPLSVYRICPFLLKCSSNKSI